MRTLGFLLLSTITLLSLTGCAALGPQPTPLTADDVIARTKNGASAKEIINELFQTNTVLPATAAELVRLHNAGVATEVLDYLQYAQLQEIRWRDQINSNYWYGPGFYGGFGYGYGPCPFPPRRYRGRFWGC